MGETGSGRPPHDPGGRARWPDAEGLAERDGVRIAWASYGSGDPTIVLLPTWVVVPSRVWRAQVPYLSRHFRVITFDGRGSGRSDRPVGGSAYTAEEYAADTVAVLDAAGVDQAVLVGWSMGANWAVHVAAEHPERVLGVLAIGPACRFDDSDLERAQQRWAEAAVAGESRWRAQVWRDGGYPACMAEFFPELFSESHSTKQIEDGLGWALELDTATAVATMDGFAGAGGAVATPLAPVCARVRCPVTVLHGTDDRVNPLFIAERLAELTGGTLVRLEGAGHGPLAREPVVVNTEIRRFAERLRPPVRSRTWTRALDRGPKLLYISSPIGLGHARRDLAIAEQLRTVRPDVRIDWLAQHPVTRVLDDHGENVHPASAYLANESTHIEAEAGEHDLHAFGAIRRMDEILVNNFGVFADLIADEPYDLVVGDEAWDVDYFLHENPELKRSAYAWFTDFVGWLPMPDRGDREAQLTADYNAEMLEQRARFRRLRDRSIFVGQPDDVVPDTFGPGLPSIRAWTRENFDFTGYVTGFEPISSAERERLRAKHGYRSDEQVCVVAVGGSGVGAPLLRRVLDAVPVARRTAPDLRFVVVAGPRIDPASLPRRRGARVVGYLPDLYEHLAACDVAVVQGGLTTCMELAAANRPFLYVPLRHHFEQSLHVRHRLERYRAGTCVSYDRARDPDALAADLMLALHTPADCRRVESDGAQRAAAMLADLL